jgi:hypothetical protein
MSQTRKHNGHDDASRYDIAGDGWVALAWVGEHRPDISEDTCLPSCWRVRVECSRVDQVQPRSVGGRRRPTSGPPATGRPSDRTIAGRRRCAGRITRDGTLGTLCRHSTRAVGSLGGNSARSRQQPTLAASRDPCSGSPMHVVDFDRYRLRLDLECPLASAPRSEHAGRSMSTPPSWSATTR